MGIEMQAALTSKERAGLTPDEFAVPGKRKLPIDNAEHVKLAWDLLDDTDGITGAEKREAKRLILAGARRFHVDTSGWKGA